MTLVGMDSGDGCVSQDRPITPIPWANRAYGSEGNWLRVTTFDVLGASSHITQVSAFKNFMPEPFEPVGSRLKVLEIVVRTDPPENLELSGNSIMRRWFTVSIGADETIVSYVAKDWVPTLDVGKNVEITNLEGVA